MTYFKLIITILLSIILFIPLVGLSIVVWTLGRLLELPDNGAGLTIDKFFRRLLDFNTSLKILKNYWTNTARVNYSVAKGVVAEVWNCLE